MLSAALKDNEFLERSLVSSSGRLSGVFSWEINNQDHVLFLQQKHFSETYGFTKVEVRGLLEKDVCKVGNDFDGVTKWYNGYQILNEDEPTIYNGWYIINYLSNSIENQKKMFDNYWAKAGWLDTLCKLFVNNDIREAIDKLIKNKIISIEIAEPTVKNILELKRTIRYPQEKLNQQKVDFFLQLLWDDGLLNAVEKHGNDVKLKIPNLEIKKEIQSKCYSQSIFEINYRLKPMNINRYIKALKQLLLITTRCLPHFYSVENDT
jgi:hypothetical protein